jgi:hypothetical protein
MLRKYEARVGIIGDRPRLNPKLKGQEISINTIILTVIPATHL